MCGNLFGTKQTTQQEQQSTQSGGTTSNFLPQLQQAYNTLQGQYGSLGDMGANQFQQQAAQAQTGVAANLTPGYSAASSVAQNGISPNAINQYMSPYISSVVNAYNQQQDLNDAQALSQQQASAAKAGALTGSTAQGADAYLRSQLQSQRNLNTANLLNSGFSQAGSLAGQSTNAQLAGANTLGSLTGVNTAANTGLGTLGTNLQQAGTVPYTLASQYASGTSGLANAAGQSYTGQSSGTSSGTTDQSQGLGTVAAGLLGAYLFGRKARGGAVDGDSIHERYKRTVSELQRMHGGGVEGYAEGGAPDGYADARGFVPASDNDPGAAPSNPGFSLGSLGSFLPTYDSGIWKGEAPSQSQRLGYALTQVGMNNPFAGFGKETFGQYNEEEARRQARYMQAQQLAQQAAIATGQVNGQPTLAAKGLPSEIALREAQAKAAGVQSDKEFLLNIEKQKMDYQKQLALEQQEKEWALYQKLMEQQKAREAASRPQPKSIAPGRYKWNGTPDLQQGQQ